MANYSAEMENELEQNFAQEQESVLEQEYEQHEHEQQEQHEHEHEQENEAFFNHLAALADRQGRSHALRKIALTAARQAMGGARKKDPAVEGEFEFEHEGSFELELESDPAIQRHLEAQLEHLGHAAAEAANEQEAAEHFLPLIPLAAKFLLPMAMKALPAIAKAAPKIIGRVVPQLTRGVGNIARALHRSPTTRPLLNALPKIARGTIGGLAKQVARGRRITPQTALRTLAQQTARTLNNPRQLARTYRRSVALDRRYHKSARRVIGGRPPGQRPRAQGWGYAGGAGAGNGGGSAGPGYGGGGAGPGLSGGAGGPPPSYAGQYGSRRPAAAIEAYCPCCGRPR